MERFFEFLWQGALVVALFILLSPFLGYGVGEVKGAALATYLSHGVQALVVGGVYALLALGLSLIYKTTRVINFAQADFMALAVVAVWLVAEVSGHAVWLALVIGVGVGGVFAAGVERVVMRPLDGRPLIFAVMATFGLSLGLRGVLSAMVGEHSPSLDTPFAGQVFRLAGIVVTSGQIAAMLTALVTGALLFLFVRHSLWGRLAAARHERRPVPGEEAGGAWVGAVAWGLAGALAAVAGTLVAPAAGLSVPETDLVFKALAAAWIGGPGSLRGAVLGGLFIGYVDVMSAAYLWPGSASVMAFALLVVAVLLRPQKGPARLVPAGA